jgi:hypothetical protein
MMLAAAGPSSEDEARDLAERLHAMGTHDALATLTAKRGHAKALALMRDARWHVAGSGDVPLVGDSESLPAMTALIRLRLGSAGRMMARRWAGASCSGALGGIVAGMFGGAALYVAPDSNARPQSALALAAIGALAGGLGGAGIGAGLAAAEVLARSRRGLALALCGAVAGAAVASIAHLLLRALLDGLFGLDLAYRGGAFDGLVLGAAAGSGYGLATRQPPGGGLAAPSGSRRVRVAVTVGIGCALAATALALWGRLLVGGIVHAIAQSSRDSGLVLAPLGHLIGEPDFGLMSRTLLSAFEGAIFGYSLAWGLTWRPSARPARHT